MVEKPSTYLVSRRLTHRACCQCGWMGKRRWIRGSAVYDVLAHCSETGHVPDSMPPINTFPSGMLLAGG